MTAVDSQLYLPTASHRQHCFVEIVSHRWVSYSSVLMSYQIEHDIPSSIILAETVQCSHRDHRIAQLNQFEFAQVTSLQAYIITRLNAWYNVLLNMPLKEKWEAFTTRIGLNRLVGNISSWINTDDDRDHGLPDVYISE